MAQRYGMTGKTTPLYVVCSPCRCVGKTLISRLLTEFYVVKDRPVTAFDLADEGPQLSDYLPKFATVVDIGDIRGQMALFDHLIAEKDTPRVIDVSHRAFKNFFTIVRAISFFEEARRRYDYIVLDVPPLCPVQDCRVIAHWVDGFLLVVAAHHTPRRLVEEALNVVERGKVLGFVFNGDDHPPPSFYGYHGYYGGGGYLVHGSPNGHGRGRLGRTLTRVGRMLQGRRGGKH